VIAERCIPDGMLRRPKTRAALAYAERLHAGQQRGVDRAPFITHPLEVACLLDRVGAPDRVIAAGVLHDIIEKTDVDAADLRARFGATVTRLVLAVSEDDRISGYVRRKAALREQVAQAGTEAMMVFAADKISKVQELSREHAAIRRAHRQPGGGSRARERRLAHYHSCLVMLEDHLGDSPLVTQLRSELEALSTQHCAGSCEPHRRHCAPDPGNNTTV
jgi:(p)ppGpp synthase/HD superfamily hydrolase